MTRKEIYRTVNKLYMKGPALVALLIFIFCAGCTLLKKNTKSTQENKLETNEQFYLERVDLKAANKETKIYTYWKDSLLYQYQHTLENTNETKHSALRIDNKQVSKQQQQLKKTEPPDLLIHGIIVVALIGILILLYVKTVI